MKQSFYLSGCMCMVLLAGACRTSGIQPQKNQNMDSQIIVSTTSPKGGTASISSPPVYIYKTREDYSHLVPVIMNDAVPLLFLIRTRVTFVLVTNCVCLHFWKKAIAG